MTAAAAGEGLHRVRSLAMQLLPRRRLATRSRARRAAWESGRATGSQTPVRGGGVRSSAIFRSSNRTVASVRGSFGPVTAPTAPDPPPSSVSCIHRRRLAAPHEDGLSSRCQQRTSTPCTSVVVLGIAAATPRPPEMAQPRRGGLRAKGPPPHACLRPTSARNPRLTKSRPCAVPRPCREAWLSRSPR